MSDAVEEYLKFTIAIKTDEMKRGLESILAQIKTFDQQAKAELGQVGIAFDSLDKRAKALQLSMTASLAGLQKEMHLLSATSRKVFTDLDPNMNKANFANYIGQLMQIGQASRQAATGMERLQTQQNALANAPKPDWDAAAAAALKEAEASRKMAEEVKRANEQIATSTRSTSATVKQELGKEAKAAADTGKAGKKMADDWTGSLKDVEKALSGVAMVAGTALAALAASGGYSLNAFGDLEAEANTLMAVSGATSAEIEHLTEKSMQLGEAYGYTAVQLENADTELARLGFTSQEVSDAIEAVAISAKASGESVGNASTLIAGTIRGFGLDAKDAGHVADVLAKAANVSAVSFGSLQLSMKYVAPVARASNQGLSEMTAILGLLGNNMILGEQAGTSLRSMLTSLVNPGTDAKRIFDEINFTAQDSNGKLKPLAQVFEELREKMAKFNDVGKGKMLAEIFGQEALSAAQVLMKASKEDLDKLTSSLKNVDGASKDTADIMQQGLNAELARLKSGANNLAIAIGGDLSPAVKDCVGFLKGLLDIVTELPEPVRKTGVQVLFLAGSVTALSLAFGGALVGGGKLLNLIKGLAVEGTVLARILPLLAGPVGVIAGVATVGTIAAVNVYEDQVNKKIERDNQENPTQTNSETGLSVGTKNLGAIRFNELTRLSNSGKLGTLSREKLQEALDGLKKDQEAYKELLVAEKELADLKNQLAERQGRGNKQSLTEFDQAPANDPQITKLSQQIAAKEQLIEQSRKDKEELLRAHQTMEKNDQLMRQLSSAIQKKNTPEGTENYDPEAARQADQAAQKRVDSLSDKHQRETAALKTELDKQVALIAAKNSQITSADSAMSDKLVTNAKNVANEMGNSYGKCLTGVQYAFQRTYGEYIKAGESAYLAAAALAKDPRFKEVQVSDEQMSRLPKGTIVVHDRSPDPSKRTKGGWYHGHISVADGQGNEISDHTEKQMVRHYAGGGRRVFMPAGAGGEDIQKMLLQQQALIKQTEVYKRQLGEMKALRDQQTQGSDAWLKADKAVFDLQQKIDQSGVDSIQARADLEKKQREDALRWAQESLSIDADVAEAKAKLTSDTFDDIQAGHQKTMAALQAEEMGRLAQEGTTEAQRLKIKEKYNALRLVAEKAHTDAILAERLRLERSTEDLLIAGEQAEIALLQEGLDKDLALSKQREDSERTRLTRQLQDMELKKQQKTDDYALVELALTELTQKGETEREKIRAQFANRRQLEALGDLRAKADMDLRSSLSGQRNPEIVEGIQSSSLQEKFRIQQAITEELESQKKAAISEALAKKQSIDGSEVIHSLERQITDSKRTQFDLELQMNDIALQAIDRERQMRLQSIQEMLKATDLTLNAFARIAGINQTIGSNVAGWVGRLEGFMTQMKDGQGNPLSLLDIFKSDDTNTWSKDSGLDNLNNSLSEKFGAKQGDLLSAIPVIGTALGAASDLGITFPQLMESLSANITNVFFGDPLKLKAQADAHKAQLLQLDLEIQDARIAQAKARGEDTFELEQEQIRKRAQEELAELEKQKLEVESKKTGFGGLAYTKEEEAAIQQFQEYAAQKRISIDQNMQNLLLGNEKDRLQRVLDANSETAQAIADARLNAESQTAALTPGGKDDRTSEKNRREAEVWKTYLGRINTAMQQAGTGNWAGVGDLILAAGKEKDSSLAGLDNDIRLKGIQEEARIRGEIAQTREMEINLSLKGASKEIELLREKIRLEQASLEDQMKDPSLSPEEYQAKERRRALLQDTLEKGETDVPRKWARAAANAAIDLTAEIAKGTKTGLDDAVADYEAALQQISEAEEDARENLEGPQLDSTLRKLGQARLNAEKDTQKKLKEIWLQEYSERLNQQKTLIQEQLELNSRGMEDQIRDIQIAMLPLQAELENMQRLLDASKRARDAEKKVYNPGDGKRNPKFKSDLSALDADSLAWAGVKEIANTATHDGLSTVSGKTKREGLLKEAELQELEANNQLSDERITEAEFAQKMQRAQLIRAKAAEMELATADLTRTRKLELEKEWAEAYANWQKYASDAIDARYDADDQRTQENMDLKQLALDQQQQAIDALQLQLDTLQDAAEKKIRPIDDEILRATQSTRDWAPAWAEVTAGIAAARKEAEALLAAQERAASKTTAKTSSLTRTKTPDATHTVAGTDGYYYQTTSQMQGLADGGIVPNKSRYAGDKYGPVMLDRFEAVIPLRRLPELVRPWMPPPTKSYASSFSPQITISGNYIVGEFDMYQTAYRAAGDLYRENSNNFAGNAGPLF